MNLKLKKKKSRRKKENKNRINFFDFEQFRFCRGEGIFFIFIDRTSLASSRREKKSREIHGKKYKAKGEKETEKKYNSTVTAAAAAMIKKSLIGEEKGGSVTSRGLGYTRC